VPIAEHVGNERLRSAIIGRSLLRVTQSLLMALPILIAGVGQLNIQLANNTPSGSAQPLVIPWEMLEPLKRPHSLFK